MDATYSTPKKPNDWPVNMAEESLDAISKALDEFIEEPGYVKRENLISRISNYDLNERAFIGEYRISEYEVGKINGIYSRSLMILLPAPRCYLYSFIGERARMQKMMSYTMSMQFQRQTIWIKEKCHLLLGVAVQSNRFASSTTSAHSGISETRQQLP